MDDLSLVETSVCKLGLLGEASCFPKSEESLLESKFHQNCCCFDALNVCHLSQ